MIGLGNCGLIVKAFHLNGDLRKMVWELNKNQAGGGAVYCCSATGCSAIVGEGVSVMLEGKEA
jgi:hypothetical protein